MSLGVQGRQYSQDPEIDFAGREVFVVGASTCVDRCTTKLGPRAGRKGACAGGGVCAPGSGTPPPRQTELPASPPRAPSHPCVLLRVRCYCTLCCGSRTADSIPAFMMTMTSIVSRVRCWPLKACIVGRTTLDRKCLDCMGALIHISWVSTRRWEACLVSLLPYHRLLHCRHWSLP